MHTHARIPSLIILTISLLCTLCLAPIAFAQEEDRGPLQRLLDARQNRIESPAGIRVELAEDRVETRTEFQTRTQDIRTTRLDTRAEIRTDAHQLRTEVRTQFQTANTPEEKRAVLEEARTERELIRERLLQTNEDARDARIALRADMQTEVAQRIKAHLENILNRLDNALEKFSSILSRIESRIDELTGQGADTTAATDALVEAEVAVTVATTNIAEAHTLFEEALESENPRNYLDDIKVAVRTATESVKEAFASIREAIRALKSITRPASTDAQADVDAEVDADTE